MRLGATARFSLKLNLNKSCLCIFFFLFLVPVILFSQEFKLTFSKGTALSEALQKTAETYNFKVAFDSERLKAILSKNEVRGNNIEQLLCGLLANTGYTYIFKHGCYLIIRDIEKKDNTIAQDFNLTGSITDINTGEQLPFAAIVLPYENINATASSNGTFSIKNIVSNPVHIMVSHIGYHPADTLLYYNESMENVVLLMKQNITTIRPVDIVQNKLDIIDYREDADFATAINPSRMSDMPMLVETDIFRTLQLLPGISYSENTSELCIRGGTSDQNMVLFDGQTLYNLSHYYGVFSSVNPNIVKDIQVFKGGFDSRYGERISGIVDITGKSGNRGKPTFYTDINLLTINMGFELPLTPKLTVLAAGRRSYSDIYSTSFADKLFETRQSTYKNYNASKPSFHFYDLNGKINYRINERENLSLSVYGGRDEYINHYTFSDSIANADSSLWYNYGISLNWQRQWNASLFTSIIFGSSGYDNSSSELTSIDTTKYNAPVQTPAFPDSQRLSVKTKNANNLSDFSITSRNTYLLNSSNTLNFGILIRRNEFSYNKNALKNPDKKYIYDNINQSSWIMSVYAQDWITLTGNLVIKPGFRLTYYNGDHNFYFEPRLSANYKLNANWSWRISTGKYYQFISQVSAQQETGYSKSFWALSNDSLNPVLKSNHFMTGFNFERKRWTIDVEAYFKKFTGQQEYVFISPLNPGIDNMFPDKPKPPEDEFKFNKPSYFITGKGRSYGIDVYLGFRSQKNTSWISYSLSRCWHEYKDINYGKRFPSLTDQSHQFRFSSLFTFGKWNLGSITLFSTGRPYYFTRFNGSSDYTIERKYERLPDYFRFDVSANYRFDIKTAHFKTGLSIINLFNTRNYFDVNTKVFNLDSTAISESSLVQSQKLSLNLFLHINL